MRTELVPTLQRKAAETQCCLPSASPMGVKAFETRNRRLGIVWGVRAQHGARPSVQS